MLVFNICGEVAAAVRAVVKKLYHLNKFKLDIMCPWVKATIRKQKF